ncbi:hypothetical protein F5876DRAFT_14644, partial [Lentinula aff. lateritia]
AEETICNYAASFMAKEAGGTVRAKIAAVKNLVTSKGFGWRGGIRLREVLNEVERAAPASSFRPERMPLHLLHDELDNTGRNTFNSCIVACANSVFYGQLRLSEVLSQSSLPSKYNNLKLPLVRDLTIPHASDKKTLAKLHPPCTKT